MAGEPCPTGTTTSFTLTTSSSGSGPTDRQRRVLPSVPLRLSTLPDGSLRPTSSGGAGSGGRSPAAVRATRPNACATSGSSPTSTGPETCRRPTGSTTGVCALGSATPGGLPSRGSGVRPFCPEAGGSVGGPSPDASTCPTWSTLSSRKHRPSGPGESRVVGGTPLPTVEVKCLFL